MSHFNIGDTKVKFLEKDPKYFLNKSTIIYGASGTGKSTILIEILHILKDHVPNIFVFSPTADDNNGFAGIVPDALIFRNVDIKKLEEIYKRQQGATRIYNTVNEQKGLRTLFEKVANTKTIEFAKDAYRNANNLIAEKQNSVHLNFGEKKKMIKGIKDARDKFLLTLYKTVIRKNKTRLKNMNITPAEHYILQYLDFNPNCIIIMDDCGAVLKKFQKETVIQKIFFQGRHSYINLILSLQDDLRLDSSIKKNAFVNIFTTSQIASAYFNRAGTSFSKKEKQLADKIISHVFTDSKDYKKLVYVRNEVQPFRYTIADIYEDFRFGCPKLWELDENMSEKKKKCNFDDPLLSPFKIEL